MPIPSCCVLISIASFAQPATVPSLCVEEEEQQEETSGHSEQANILHPCLQAMPSRIAFHFRVKPVYGSHGYPIQIGLYDAGYHLYWQWHSHAKLQYGHVLSSSPEIQTTTDVGACSVYNGDLGKR